MFSTKKINYNCYDKYSLGNYNVALQKGSTVATVNGEEKTLDIALIISNERTFMLLRFVAENLGLKVGWI